MNYEQLHFNLNTEPPDLDDMTIYESIETGFLGHDFVFNIIGSSHYINCPALNYHETSSCDTMRNGEIHSYRLTKSIDAHFTFKNNNVEVRVHVDSRPLETFPDGKDFDVFYEFEENAITSLQINQESYETYHTYPEYDLNLYTQTEFIKH